MHTLTLSPERREAAPCGASTEVPGGVPRRPWRWRRRPVRRSMRVARDLGINDGILGDKVNADRQVVVRSVRASSVRASGPSWYGCAGRTRACGRGLGPQGPSQRRGERMSEGGTAQGLAGAVFRRRAMPWAGRGVYCNRVAALRQVLAGQPVDSAPWPVPCHGPRPASARVPAVGGGPGVEGQAPVSASLMLTLTSIRQRALHQPGHVSVVRAGDQVALPVAAARHGPIADLGPSARSRLQPQHLTNG